MGAMAQQALERAAKLKQKFVILALREKIPPGSQEISPTPTNSASATPQHEANVDSTSGRQQGFLERAAGAATNGVKTFPRWIAKFGDHMGAV